MTNCLRIGRHRVCIEIAVLNDRESLSKAAISQQVLCHREPPLSAFYTELITNTPQTKIVTLMQQCRDVSNLVMAASGGGGSFNGMRILEVSDINVIILQPPPSSI